MTKASETSDREKSPRSRAAPRKPSRSRGVLRYAALVDATEALLMEFSPDDVGLYQIAERAQVPPASVYHFFPTKEAAFLALSRRYLHGFTQLSLRPLPPHALTGWQSLVEWEQRGAMDYYNAHEPALKLLYGGYGGLQTRQLDRAYNELIARTAYDRWNRLFHMPFVRDPDKRFNIVLGIMDAIWSISYVHHGKITDEYFRESFLACVAYCRLFLPEEIELRREHRITLQQGGLVSLPRLAEEAETP